MNEENKRENLRILILDFIANPMCEEDEAAWKRHLNTYDELLAEVKRLREQFRLAYDWVDYQLSDGGMKAFAEYIGDEEE